MDLRFAPGFKLMSHRQFIDYFENKEVYPINIEISPSGICNASCENCFYRQNENQLKGLDKFYIDENRMEKLIIELAELKVKSISWTGGGEPTLHPSFSKFAKWTYEAGIQQGLFTNALREIEYDPELFQWIRVTRTNKPLNVELIKKLRRCRTLGICLNYSENDNEETIKELLSVAEELDSLKINPNHSTYVQVRPALKIMGESYENEVPNIKHPLLQITNYKFMGLTSERNYKVCEAYHFAPFIWQDGDVDVCGYHRKEKNFNLGNLYDRGTKGLFKYIMKNAAKNVNVIDTCQICCKLNEMNSMIEYRKQLDKKDINFP